MHGLGLDRALFYMVCKDDDRIATERIRVDTALAEKYIQRGHEIVLTDRMPEPVYLDPTYFEAKFSDYYAAYFPESATTQHWAKLKPQRESVDPLLARICVNFRNDARTTILEDGTFYSERYQSAIPFENQGDSDDGHVLHPDIMALAGWKMVDGLDENTAVYELPNGQRVANGKPSARVYSSEHLLTDPYKCAGSYERGLKGGRLHECASQGMFDL